MYKFIFILQFLFFVTQFVEILINIYSFFSKVKPVVINHNSSLLHDILEWNAVLILNRSITLTIRRQLVLVFNYSLVVSTPLFILYSLKPYIMR